MLSSSQAQSFKTNLNKLVRLVLFDVYPKDISISKILEQIKNKYMLDFTEEEIFESIKAVDKIEKLGGESINGTFRIQPEEYKKIQSKETINIDEYISLFVKEFESQEPNIKDFKSTKDLIYKFLYYTFNSDSKTLLDLLKSNNVTVEQKFCLNDEFTPQEATVINLFLDWNYPPKNEFVMTLISSCFDYCMLTIKKDANSYSGVFNGKEFYLDSNIIFRMVGLDNAERQTAINNFISKCRSAGIKILYTNHTYDEIKKTINHYVDIMQKNWGKQPPLATGVVKLLSPRYSKSDFYDMYYEWCKVLYNKPGDFISFKKDIIKRIDKVLKDCKMIVADNYATSKNKRHFSELCDEFQDYKTKNYRKTNINSIATDINNYLFMCKINNNGQASNFLQIKSFFITADHCLTEWSSNERAGAVPIFVLPSVWYSILLKYKGRTDDDYAAFCQFLNIRIAPEKDCYYEKKELMLAKIMSLNENADVKEEIIFDINERLSDPNVLVDDIDSFVEESHQTILDTKIKESERKMNKSHEEKLRDISEEKSKYGSEREKAGESKGYESGRKSIIDQQAESILKTNKAICIIAVVLAIIVAIGLVLVLIGNLTYKDANVTNELQEFLSTNSETLAWICGIIDFIVICLAFIRKITGILPLEKEIIVQKLEKKYQK